MTFVYVASPYSGTPEQMDERHEAVREYTAYLHDLEVPSFSPIVHGHSLKPLMRHPGVRTWEYWRRMDFPMVAAAHTVHVLCLEGWRRSVGVTAEIEFARAQGRAVRYVVPLPTSAGLLYSELVEPPSGD